MKKVLTIILVLLLLAAIVLYQQELTAMIMKLLGMEEKKEAPIKSIASISMVNKKVALKRATTTEWDAAAPQDPLAIMDSISTDLESTATIKFNIGYLMDIGQRSLIVIEDPKFEAASLIELTFDDGSMDAKTTETARPDTTLRIKSNNTTTEVKGKSDLSMSVDKANKKAEIWMRIGEARVRDKNGTEIIIRENEKKSFSTELIEKEPEPAPQEEIAPPPPPPPAPVKIAPKPKPTPKKPLKTLSRNEIIRAVARQRKKIDTCYERNRRGSSGKNLAVKMTIKNTGVVSNAEVVRSNMNDPAIERCVIFWVKAIKFPQFDGKPTQETVNFAFQ